MFNQIEGVSDEELEKACFKVELIPNNFPVGGLFVMSGYTFLHIKNKKCIMIMLENEIKELPYA